MEETTLMKIWHDISYVGQGHQQMIDRGYAADVVHSLRLSFQYTQEEQERNRLMFETTPQDGRQMDYGKAAMQKSMEIYPVMEAIAQEFVCYQFDPASGVPYSSDQWELFFWCNDFYNTAQGSSLSGRDYSYITLSFNEDYHTVEKRRVICDRVLAFLQEKFGGHPHLDVAVQHGVWMDTEKIRRDAKNLLPYLMGPCVYEGQEGKIIWTANGPVFMKKRARRYGYRLGDVDILRIAWKRGLSADAAPETEHDTAPCLAAQ
jgi:hypothetical protein